MESPFDLLRNNIELEHITDIVKPESEVSAWATEEDLTECQKCEIFLQSGFPLQKAWVMQNLHFLLENKAIFQRVFKNIINWSEELQLECGSGLLSLIQKELLPDDLKLESIELSLTFLSFYSRTLHSRWLPVFTSLLPLIPLPLIRSKIVPELMLLSDFSQKAITRQVSCHLIAGLASVIGKEFKGALLQRAKSLSQDTNPEVREEMSKVWLVIIKAVGKTVLEESIYFDVLKLVEDEVESVKCAGIKLLILILEQVSELFFHKEIESVLIREVYRNSHPTIEETICELLGVLIEGSQLKTENLLLIKKLSSKDLPSRKSLAYHFPGIVQLTGLSNDLKELAVNLASDSSSEVRKTLAAGFHEVLALNKHCKVLKKVALKLLDDLDTRIIVFKRLKQWTEIFDPSQILLRLIQLLSAQVEWRVQVAVLGSFKEGFSNFPLTEVLDHLVPLLVHKMLTAALPVKKSASNCMVIILKNTFYICRKFDLCNIMKEKLARSKSSFDRIIFAYFAEKMSKVCSKKFFFRHFLEDFLSLASDRVQGVRVQFLESVEEVALNTGPEVFIKRIKEIEFGAEFLRNAKWEVLGKLESKNFEAKTGENLIYDRQKEAFEAQQELQEIREKESKKKVSDEIGAKLADGKKKPVQKVKTQAEPGDKSRGTKSTAAIKPLTGVKK